LVRIKILKRLLSHHQQRTEFQQRLRWGDIESILKQELDYSINNDTIDFMATSEDILEQMKDQND
jgi:hypothetical protein